MVNISTTSTILSLLALLLFGGIGGVYLSVAGAISTASKQVDHLNYGIMQMNHENEQLLSDIAYAESLENIKQQASALGFVPTNPDNIRYMKITNLPSVTPRETAATQFSNDVNNSVERTWFDPIIDWIAGYNH